MDGRHRAALAVAARRGALDMTQQQLADEAGVDVKTIGNLESRDHWPIARTRARIERALGWPAGEMDRLRLADPDDELVISPELRGMIEALSPAEREWVKAELAKAERRLRRREDPVPGTPKPDSPEPRQAAG